MKTTPSNPYAGFNYPQAIAALQERDAELVKLRKENACHTTEIRQLKAGNTGPGSTNDGTSPDAIPASEQALITVIKSESTDSPERAKAVDTLHEMQMTPATPEEADALFEKFRNESDPQARALIHLEIQNRVWR